jgi:valyl-tRNA synthetase
MSKSLGNAALDPLDVAKEYGADAGRMALIVGTSPGTDIKISKDKIKGYKHFANKLWNITRFVLSTAEAYDATAPLTASDQEIYDSWRETMKNIASDIDGYRLHLAGESIYHYIWGTFADTILEESKALLQSDDAATRASRQKLLVTILKENLIALHPFMPFVTETLWELMPDHSPLLMITPWEI